MDRKLSLKGVNLKRRIAIAVILITVIPSLVFVCYIYNYYISRAVLLILGLIVFLGWIIALEVLFSILRIHSESQLTLKELGEERLAKDLTVRDEVEGLETAFKLISSKVKSSLEELKDLSSRIETLNKELAKKINILSTVTQIHSFISRGEHRQAFGVVLERVREALKLSKANLLFIKEEKQGWDLEYFFEYDGSLEIFKKKYKDLFTAKSLLLLDEKHHQESILFLRESLGLRNLFVFPLQFKGEVVGVFVGGNNLYGFSFSSEDIELIETLSKSIVLIWEHRRLYRVVKDLEIYDPLTGLYNKKYLQTRLNEEIRRATTYQRPCGLLLVKITNYREIQSNFGVLEGERILKKIGEVFKESLRPIDIPARIEEDTLAVILIERNKRQSQYTGVNIIERLNSYFKEEKLKPKFSSSVAENPVDGDEAQKLISYAFSHLEDNEDR